MFQSFYLICIPLTPHQYPKLQFFTLALLTECSAGLILLILVVSQINQTLNKNKIELPHRRKGRVWNWPRAGMGEFDRYKSDLVRSLYLVWKYWIMWACCKNVHLMLRVKPAMCIWLIATMGVRGAWHGRPVFGTTQKLLTMHQQKIPTGSFKKTLDAHGFLIWNL